MLEATLRFNSCASPDNTANKTIYETKNPKAPDEIRIEVFKHLQSRTIEFIRVRSYLLRDL